MVPTSAALWVLILVAVAVTAGCAETRSPLPPPILTIGIPKPQPTPAPAPVYTPPPPVPYLYRGTTIVVDAGHGGEDSGTRGTGFSYLPEKSINLMIAQNLAQNLRMRGANVVMTRTGDWFIELGARADKGDEVGASLFVSVHIDASPRNSSASGTTVYIHNNAGAGSERVARCINAAIQRAGLECRGVKRANYKVLRESNRAAVLIECGFITNFSDAHALNNASHRAKIAAAIAQGIASYYGW